MKLKTKVSKAEMARVNEAVRDELSAYNAARVVAARLARYALGYKLGTDASHNWTSMDEYHQQLAAEFGEDLADAEQGFCDGFKRRAPSLKTIVGEVQS